MKRYINNISSLQITQLLRFANLFLIGVVFVRYFSTQEIGYYEKFIFIAGTVSFFWLQGISQAFLSLVKSTKKELSTSKSAVYFNTFILLFIFSIITVLLLFIFKNIIKGSTQVQTFFLYFKYLVLYILFSIPASMTEYVYLGLNQAKKLLIYGIVSQSLHFIFLISPALFGFPFVYSLMALVAISFLRFAWLIYILHKHTHCTLKISFIKRNLKIAYPLIISTLLSGSASYIDGLLVNHFFSNEQFAIFRFGAKELPISLILSSAFSNAMIPVFSEKPFGESLNQIKKYSTRLFHFLFPLTWILLLTSNLFFPIIFSEHFAFSAKVFNVYLLLIVFRMAFPNTILLGKQKTKPFLWVSAIEISVNIFFSLLLIPYLGLLGIAYATLIAYGVEKVLLMQLVKKYFSVKVSDYLNIKPYILYSILLIITYLITDYITF